MVAGVMGREWPMALVEFHGVKEACGLRCTMLMVVIVITYFMLC